MPRRRNLWFIAVAIAIVVIVLREAGVLSLQLVQTRDTCRTISLNLGDGECSPFSLPRLPPAPGTANATGDGTGDVILEAIRNQMESSPALDVEVKGLRIDSIRMTGCRWVPLYKPMGGTITASLMIHHAQNGAPSESNRGVKVDVEMSVLGVCSARDARQEFAKVAARELVRMAAAP